MRYRCHSGWEHLTKRIDIREKTADGRDIVSEPVEKPLDAFRRGPVFILWHLRPD